MISLANIKLTAKYHLINDNPQAKKLIKVKNIF